MITQKNFSILEIFFVVIIILLLVGGIIPNLYKMNRSANDRLAKAILNHLSTASEAYKVSLGRYPDSLASLIKNSPSSLRTSLCGSNFHGYTFACTFDGESYSFTATPLEPGRTGSKTFQISTGGVLTP